MYRGSKSLAAFAHKLAFQWIGLINKFELEKNEKTNQESVGFPVFWLKFHRYFVSITCWRGMAVMVLLASCRRLRL